MDIAFVGEIGKFVVIYMDDITVYSRSDREHIHEVQEVRYIIELKEIKFCARRRKIVGSYNI